MRLVKEILYEKFTEDSDPIDDMGLGVKHLLERSKEKIEQFASLNVKKYEFIDSIKNYNGIIYWSPSSYIPMRYVYVIISEKIIAIHFYRNIYRKIGTKDILNKIDMAKEFLEYTNLSLCVEEQEKYKFDYPYDYFTTYPPYTRLIEIQFNIKNEYLKYLSTYKVNFE